MSGSCNALGEMRNAYKIFVGNPEGNGPLGRYHNIKMDLWDIWLDGVDWIHLPHDRDRWRAVVNTVINLCVS
jgi:hypothetical protein